MKELINEPHVHEGIPVSSATVMLRAVLARTGAEFSAVATKPSENSDVLFVYVAVAVIISPLVTTAERE